MDYNRKVQVEEAEKYANEHNFIFQEVSAMSGDGIQELFMNKLIEQIRTHFIQKKNFLEEEEEKLKINLKNTNISNNNQIKKKKKCCPCFQ